MPSVEIKHDLDLDTELPKEFKNIAREQGECENTKRQVLDDFRKYILGRYYKYLKLHIDFRNPFKNTTAANLTERMMNTCRNFYVHDFGILRAVINW